MKKVKASLIAVVTVIAIAGSVLSAREAKAQVSNCNANACPGSGAQCCTAPDGSQFVKGR